MARKSRRSVATVAAEKNDAAVVYYPTAIYARLSIENSGKDDEGDSIANQISFCRDYLKNASDLRLYDIYEDNGQKGTRFDRPEFQRLMDDVRAGKVKCIVVKDLSRFGRNYLEAGEYLEKIFPFMGVRFISITDGYDSLLSSDAEGALMIPLKNMINDVYAKDISRKIITSFRARQEKGEFLPAFAPYGYVKSQTQQYRYEPDPVTAPYVKLIFEWKAAGVSHSEICNRLNDMGAITPARRKVELGIWKAEKYKHTIWHGRSILDILQNPTYTGAIVYGRMPKSLYQGIKIHRGKPEELRILPGMHEPLVSQELFDQVQAIFAETKKNANRKMEQTADVRSRIINLFKGKIYCGDCGKRMRFIKGQGKDKQYTFISYACGGYIDTGYRKCSRHHIKYENVCDAALCVIREQLAHALDQEKMLYRLKGTRSERNLLDQYNGDYNHALREVQKVNARREGLYESFTEGVLDAEEYKYAKAEYERKAEELQKKLDAAKKKRDQLEQILSGNSKWLEALHKAENASELDQSLVDDLISKVLVYEDDRVEVELNYSEEKNAFEAVLTELLKEAN